MFLICSSMSLLELTDSHYPLRAERVSVVTCGGRTLLDAASPELAHDVARRLNREVRIVTIQRLDLGALPGANRG